jgi:hypothetical protein
MRSGSLPRALTVVFFEAKLYSAMSRADPPRKPNNQLARKLRVGLHEATKQGDEFYFILLDIAPVPALSNLMPRVSLDKATHAKAKEIGAGFKSKWLTSYWFCRYKYGRKGSLTPLKGPGSADAGSAVLPNKCQPIASYPDPR